ncbi:isochorismatase family protein [Dietzia sp.]|uniref:isochorismatase family protein n=1 Tax=Dietzia sp. TaxID=1871616 RepID=UPI002FDA6A11
MAIPAIDPYTIPQVAEPRRVDWSIEPSSCAVLVHDMQNYFVRAYDSDAEPIATALRSMAEIVAAAREAGVQIIFSAQPGDQHPLRRGLLSEFWGPGMSEGVDTEVVEGLEPQEGDIVLTKWRYSAFARTDLLQLMRQAELDQLVITGIYGHMGCQATAVEAFMNDIKPFLVGDAIADFSREEHAATIDFVNKRAGVVATAKEVTEAFGAAAAAPKGEAAKGEAANSDAGSYELRGALQ